LATKYKHQYGEVKMNTHTEKMKLVYELNTNNPEDSKIHIRPLHYWEGEDDIKLIEGEVSMDYPEEVMEKSALLLKAISTLKERKVEIMAEAVRRQTDIQRKIDNLLAIEYIP